MMTLRDILSGSPLVSVNGNLDTGISGICFDSRKATSGQVFVAIRGSQSDGHRYISSALQSGCKAVVYQDDIDTAGLEGAVTVRVADSALTLGRMASEFYGRPSESLKLLGITGTNGKTTIATLLHSIFTDMGYAAGLISTIENKIGSRVIPSTHTTPDPMQLNALLREMLDAGLSHCFMEVSSHAVDQKRIAGLKFTGAVFTNLTRDHLDYHLTFEAYRDTKKAFFDSLPSSAFALINVDDRNGRVMVQNTQARIYRYSLQSPAEFKAKLMEYDFSGLKLDLDGHEFWSRLVGRFNAYNLLAIYGSSVLLGLEPEQVMQSLSSVGPAKGRFEYLNSTEGKVAIIDYAHTPDALENVLRTIKEVPGGQDRIIVVVGAGGDRDRGKRPIMAAVSASWADQVILTSDNPRSEDPVAIIEEMFAGVEISRRRKVLKISDRREAIRTAVAMALPGDVILIAGKGHENYQEIKGVKYPFDDRKITEEAFGQ
jgi:UDP-N-acetylmuramoyl-L-alanyl-D-glutamate--2,6-diaminopimelate ligase